MNALLKQQNLRRDLGVVSWKEADHDDKLEKLIDLNDILVERIVSRRLPLFLLGRINVLSSSPHRLTKQLV